MNENTYSNASNLWFIPLALAERAGAETRPYEPANYIHHIKGHQDPPYYTG